MLQLAMELLEGKSLHTLLREDGPQHWRRVFEIAGMICTALVPTHARGVSVGSMRPETIYLVERPGEPEVVELLELRIAAITDAEQRDPKSLLRTDVDQRLYAAVRRAREKLGLVGEISYLSPEQLMGKPLDARADIFTLGVLVYELITGARPFVDDQGPAAVISQMLKKPPAPPSASVPGSTMPQVADVVVLQCIDKTRDLRFPDATALAQAIAEVLESRQTLRGIVAPPLPTK